MIGEVKMKEDMSFRYEKAAPFIGFNLKEKASLLPMDRLTLTHGAGVSEKNGQKKPQSSDFQKEFINSLPGIYYLITPKGKMLDWNKKLEEISEYSSEEISNISFFDLFPPDYRNRTEQNLRLVIEEGEGELNLPLLTKNKKKIPCHFSSQVTQVDDLTCIRGIALDDSKLIKAEVKADELERRMTAIIESSKDAIIGKKLDGTITSWNNAAEKIYGYSREEVVGENIRLIVPDDKTEELDNIMDRLKKGKLLNQLETQRVKKNGEIITVSLNISPIKTKKGKIIGASAIARDITERKRNKARSKFLLEAGTLLAESLDYDKTLSNVAELAVNIIADWCTIEIFQNGELERVAVQHSNPQKRKNALKLQEQYPRRDDEENAILKKVIEDKEPALIVEIPD